MMLANRIPTVALVACALHAAVAHAQFFDAGSDGSYGEIRVLSGETLTLDMAADAPDGIFNATTITVEPNATLRFIRNPLNTPVYLLATGDIVVQGLIDVSGGNGSSNPPVGGVAGPGGFDGGDPGFGAETPPGDGHGPGAGGGGANTRDAAGAGTGSYGTVSSSNPGANGTPYGSPLLVPLAGGSGGGGDAGQPGVGGGAGGGAILLGSNTRIHVTGIVRANGGIGRSFNHGSGGAIRLVAPQVAGTGLLDAAAVRAGDFGITAGHGRIRIDTIDRRAFQLQLTPPETASLGVFMAVFPDVVPRLDLIEVAGEPIPIGQPEPVMVLLPFGSPTLRTVVVQATGFGEPVPIQVVLTPDSGPRIVYDAEIDMNVDPDTVVVDVEFPVNRVVHVSAWTRVP